MRPALAVCLLPFLCFAQQTDLTKPPETPPLPAFKLPPAQESALPNGLRIVLVEDARFPLVTARLAFNAGSRFDPPSIPGLSQATASLLTEGTKQRSSRQLAEESASIGGAINANSGPESLTIAGNALSDHTLKLLDLMADVARNASFPLDEVKLYQQNRKQQLLEQRSQSEFLAQEKLGQMLFGNHPYSLPQPTPESIDKLTPEMVAAYRDSRLAPNNAVLILLGRLPARDALLKSIESRFGSWAKRDLPAPTTDAFPAPVKGVSLVNRPGSVQADVHIGHRGITRMQPEYFPLVVGNAILGGGAASRLFDDIREKKGYAYSVYSFHQPYKDAGRFAAVMQVRNEVTGDALKAVMSHLDRMTKEPVTAPELSNVKNYLSGNFVMGLERQEGIANQLVAMKTMGLPNDWLEKYTARIRSVEPDQITQAAKKVMAPEDASIVVVGDEKALKPELEKAGKK